MSSFNPTTIPDHIAKVHTNVTLGIDFFYVQGIPFLHTISSKIKFCTAQAVNNRQKKTIVEEVKRLVPAQDVPFSLILWYVAKTMYL